VASLVVAPIPGILYVGFKIRDKVLASLNCKFPVLVTLPDLGGKWFGTFGGSDELIDQAGMGFRVQESKLS